MVWEASEAALVVKKLPANAGDIGNTGSIPGLGRSGGGNGKPLQCSCLEDPMDRGTWWTTVHGDTKTQTWLKRLSTQARVVWESASQARQNLGGRNEVSAIIT